MKTSLEKSKLVTCKNCRQDILEDKMFLHEGFCIRNNAYCEHCERVFLKKDYDEHCKNISKGKSDSLSLGQKSLETNSESGKPNSDHNNSSNNINENDELFNPKPSIEFVLMPATELFHINNPIIISNGQIVSEKNQNEFLLPYIGINNFQNSKKSEEILDEMINQGAIFKENNRISSRCSYKIEDLENILNKDNNNSKNNVNNSINTNFRESNNSKNNVNNSINSNFRESNNSKNNVNNSINSNFRESINSNNSKEKINIKKHLRLSENINLYSDPERIKNYNSFRNRVNHTDINLNAENYNNNENNNFFNLENISINNKLNYKTKKNINKKNNYNYGYEKESPKKSSMFNSLQSNKNIFEKNQNLKISLTKQFQRNNSYKINFKKNFLINREPKDNSQKSQLNQSIEQNGQRNIWYKPQSANLKNNFNKKRCEFCNLIFSPYEYNLHKKICKIQKEKKVKIRKFNIPKPVKREIISLKKNFIPQNTEESKLDEIRDEEDESIHKQFKAALNAISLNNEINGDILFNQESLIDNENAKKIPKKSSLKKKLFQLKNEHEDILKKDFPEDTLRVEQTARTIKRDFRINKKNNNMSVDENNNEFLSDFLKNMNNNKNNPVQPIQLNIFNKQKAPLVFFNNKKYYHKKNSHVVKPKIKQIIRKSVEIFEY